MKLKRILSFVLAVAMTLSLCPDIVLPTDAADDYNLLTNGDFTQGSTGWTNNGIAPAATISDGVLTLANQKTASGDARTYSTMQLSSGTYQISFDVKGTPAQYRPYVGVSKNYWTNDYGQYFMYHYSLNDTTWTTITETFTVPESAADANTGLAPVYVTIWGNNGSYAPLTQMQFDNFAVRKVLNVSAELRDAALSEDIKTVPQGVGYTNTLTPTTGYEISKVTVTMGGTEVADVYDAQTGKISIPAVTGDLHIQAEAIALDAGNLLFNGSFNQGSNGWTGNGIAPEATISDGVLTLPAEKTASGDARTYQALQLAPGSYQLSFDVKGTPAQYRPYVGVSKNYWTYDYGQYFMYHYELSNTDWTTVTERFTVPEGAADANTGLAPVYVTLWGSNDSFAPLTQMQFDNFAVRKLLQISAELDHAALHEDIQAVLQGEGYTNTLTPDTGYEISKVTVTMGGTEVADAYDAQTGKISIPAVTGELHIQVETAEIDTTNLLSNGNFTQGSTGWTSNGIAPEATVSGGVLTLPAEKTASGDARTYQTVQLAPGSYQLSFDVKGTPAQYRPYVGVSKNAWTHDYGQYFMYQYELSDTDWTTITESFTVPESAVDANTGLAPVCITIWSSNGSYAPITQMQFDNFALRKLLQISAELDHAALSEAVNAVRQGESYVNTVVPSAGYAIAKVTVTMGGTEVTDAYDSQTGKISIPAVTGAVHICVETTEVIGYNLMVNGNFDQGSTGWADNGVAPAATIADGVLTLSTEKAASGDARTYYALQLAPGAYEITFDVKGTPSQYRPYVAVSKNYWTNDYGQYFMYQYPLRDTDWTTITQSFIVPESAADANTGLAPVYVTIWSSNDSFAPITEMQFDNFAVRKGLQVTSALSNATLLSDVKAVVSGESYNNTVLAKAGYEISQVTVTMGGAEIADAYDAQTGKISIQAVTGPLHIQVETVQISDGNLLTNGSFDHGSVGWANNGVAPAATVSDGVLTLSTEKTASGDARTYYALQLAPGAYLLSFDVKGTPAQYRPYISVSKNYWTNDYGQYFMYDYALSDTQWTTITETFLVPESEADTSTGLAPVYVTIWNSNDSFAPVTPMQFDNFTVHSGLKVTTALSNATLSSDIRAIASGDGYENTVTANPGYEISSVTVTMGGAEVADAYNPKTGKISISAVTGDLHICVETTPVVGYNLFTNGNFDQGSTGWTNNGIAPAATISKGVLTLSTKKTASGDARTYYVLHLEPGAYQLTFDVKGTPAQYRPYVAVSKNHWTNDYGQYFMYDYSLSDTKWTTVTETFLVPEGDADATTGLAPVCVTIWNSNASFAPITKMSFDNFAVRKGFVVTTELNDATLSSDIKAVVSGQSYENTVIAKGGYEISKVTVTMGGVTVPNAYNPKTGKIRIPVVTGDVHIQVETVENEKANLMVNGNFDHGNTGWSNNGITPVATIADGVLKLSTEKTASGDARTYYVMQLKPGAYLLSFRVKGTPDRYRPCVSVSKDYWTNDYGQYFMYDYSLSDTKWTTVTESFIVPDSAAAAGTGLAPVYVTVWGSNASFGPVTQMLFDDFAVHKGLKVTAELNNATLSKNIQAVASGKSYENTVIADAGYKVSKVTVTMGGIKLADAYNPKTGTISIASVTGELHIQVKTVEDETANLMTNGNFDHGNTGWANNGIAPMATIADGVLTLSAEKTVSGDARTYYAMQLKPGAYQLAFDVKGIPAQYRPYVSVSQNYWTNDYGQYFMRDYNLSDTQWTTVTESFIIPDSAADPNTGLAPVYVTVWSSNDSYAPVTQMQFDNFAVHKGLKVTLDLDNATLDKDIKAVVSGNRYVNTVIANPGYKVSKVTVTMGRTEVANAYNEKTGKIRVPAVTAKLHIQVETVEDETANLILNGNFDQGNTGWANNGVSPAAVIADGVLMLSTEKTASGDARTYYAAQLKPGTYKLSFKVKGIPAQYRPYVGVSQNYWTNDYGQFFMYKYNLSNTAWTTVTEYFEVPASAADAATGLAPVYITIWNSNDSYAPVTQMFFDDFELYKSDGVVVQKPEEPTLPDLAVIGGRPSPSPHDEYPYICDEEFNLMPNFGFEEDTNYLENTYSKIVADGNAWEGKNSLHYAPVTSGRDSGNLLTNGDFAKWNKTTKTISDWQFNNPGKLNRLEFVELDGRNAVKLVACGENEDFNLEMTQRVYLEADFTYTFSFDFYDIAHWGPNLVIYDENMKHITTMNAKTTGTEGQWTTLSTTYRPTESGYYVFAVRIHNAKYPQKEQYISNCSVTLKSTRVEYELADLKPDTNYWLTLFVKAAAVTSVEDSFITFGMTVPQTGDFILMADPASEGGRPYKTGQQLVPMAYDNQWHVLTVPFNTRELTKLNFTIDGLNCEVWFDNIYIFEEVNAKHFVSPVTVKGEAAVTDSNPKLLGCQEDQNLFENHDLSDGDAFWGENSHKFGVFGNALTVADSGSKGYGNALHYLAGRPNGTYYIKWIDVQPHTEYTFSARYAIAQPGEGFMGLINGYCLESEVTENRLFPTMIQQFGFGEDSYLESQAWQTAAVSFNSGERNRIGFVICDAGGEAYIDELRLFQSVDGIALEAVEDTLPVEQNPADTGSEPDLPPEDSGITAIVLWSLLGVLLAAAITVSIIIIQKKRKK